MADVDYSPVARVYRWLEWLVFGRALQSARVCYLEDLQKHLSVQSEPRLAVIGGGDGRFLERLLRCDLQLRVEFVDCSEGMLEVARRRVGDDARVHWSCEKFCAHQDRVAVYDAITCHFVLDCFSREQVQSFLSELRGAMKPGGYLLVSDFDPDAHVRASLLVKTMQWFFANFSQVPAVQFGKNDAFLLQNGFKKIGETQWRNGAWYSQIWQLQRE